MTHIPHDLLTQFSQFIASQMGLHFPPSRFNELEHAIQKIAKAINHLENLSNCVTELMSSPLTQSQIELLASFLTIGETYFFREKNSFLALKEKILPAIIKKARQHGRQIRIWSAGCSSGEEAYSIAIVLDQLISDLSRWNIHILATDINPDALQKLEKGIYSEWSFRETPQAIKEQYFIQTDKHHYEIIPKLKKLVTSNYLNLANLEYPSLITTTNAMDIIFCRNLLMYLQPSLATKVLHALGNSLVENGWLMVGASETLLVPNDTFQMVHEFNSIFFNRDLSSKHEENSPSEIFTPLEPDYHPPEIPLHAPISDSTFETIALSFLAESPVLAPLSTYELAQKEFTAKHFAYVCELLRPLCESTVNIDMVVLLARAYANQGQLAEALFWTKHAISHDKCNARLHYLSGIIYQELDELEESDHALQTCLYLDPKFVLAYFSLGNLLRIQGHLLKAQTYFSQALKLLAELDDCTLLPESEGMTVEKLTSILRTTMKIGVK